jgi:hypothetical protein
MYEKIAPAKLGENDEREMSVFLRELGACAKSSSTFIQSIDPLPMEEEGFYRKFTVEIQASCNTEGAARFLYFIQESPLTLKVQKCNVAGAVKVLGASGINLCLTVSRIFIPSGEAAVSAAVRQFQEIAG